jgi:hypothetical protein
LLELRIEKASRITETYLGGDPDTQEALDLCLAEGAEVTHYEVLNSIAKDVKTRNSAQESDPF